MLVKSLCKGLQGHPMNFKVMYHENDNCSLIVHLSKVNFFFRQFLKYTLSMKHQKGLTRLKPFCQISSFLFLKSTNN